MANIEIILLLMRKYFERSVRGSKTEHGDWRVDALEDETTPFREGRGGAGRDLASRHSV